MFVSNPLLEVNVKSLQDLQLAVTVLVMCVEAVPLRTFVVSSSTHVFSILIFLCWSGASHELKVRRDGFIGQAIHFQSSVIIWPIWQIKTVHLIIGLLNAAFG